MGTPYDKIKTALFGNPVNQNKKPSRIEVVQAFAEMQSTLEAAQAGAFVKDTKANLDLLVTAPVSAMAWVMTGVDSGIYENTGTAIAAVWTRRGDIPQYIISGINVGAGTVDEIQITTDLPVPSEDGAALIMVPILGTNTISPPKIRINGATAIDIVSNSGNNVVEGALIADMVITGYKSNGKFRLINDQATSSLVAAADAAAAEAIAAAADASTAGADAGAIAGAAAAAPYATAAATSANNAANSESAAAISAASAAASATDSGNSAVIAQTAANNAQSSALTVATWTDLAAITGAFSGQGAEVLDSDAGTHTDPVVGGTVNNAGRFTWSTSPTGWKRIGNTSLSSKLSIGDLRTLGIFIDGVTNTKYSAVKKLELYGTDPTKKYFLFQSYFKDSGTRCGFVISQVDADGISNQIIVCQFVLSSGANFTGITELSLVSQNGSGITGVLFWDFTDGSAFSNGSNGTYATAGIRQSCLAGTSQRELNIKRLATKAHELGFFVDRNIFSTSSLTATYLETIVTYLKNFELYGIDPSKKYYLKNFINNGTTLTIIFSKVDYDGVSNSVDVCNIVVAPSTGLVELTLTSLNSSGITGTVIVDFGNSGATWLVGNGSYELSGIRQDKLFDSTAKSSRIFKIVSDAQASGVFTPGWKKPFDDGVTNDMLRQFVKKLEIFNGNPKHQYIISRVNKTTSYARIWIKDLTSNIDQIAQFTITSPVIANLPSKIKAYALYNATPSLQMPTYAVIEVDWTKWTSGIEQTYTTFATAGIHADNVYTPEESEVFLKDDSSKFTINVGIDAECDYATLDDAINAITLENNVAGGTYSGPFFKGMSHLTSPKWAGKIKLLTSGEAPKTIDGITYTDCFGCSGLFLPEFIILEGRGKNKTLIYNTNTSKPTLQPCVDHKLFDLSVYWNGGDGSEGQSQYCLHIDPAAYVLSDMPGVKRMIHHRNVELIGGPLLNKRLLGSGVYGGTHFIREGCSAKSLNPSYSTYAILHHNTSVVRNNRPATLIEKGCSCDIERYSQLHLQSLGTGYRNTMLLDNVNYSQIQIDNIGDYADIARNRREWDLIGNYDGPIAIYDDGMVVLATTAGQTVTGTAASILFGEIDELGRGNKCVKEGASYPSGSFLDTSLAARLGDCSSSALTLTIGGQTATLNLNYTGMTNAAILTSINTSLTLYPLSIINISLEEYPKLGFTKRMQNTSGSIIGNPTTVNPGRGVFVKRTGLLTISLASDGDEIYGWCPRPINNNDWGIVVIGKRFWSAFISGATTGGTLFTPIVGKFGVGSGGVYSASATTKIGYQDNAGNIRLY